MKNRIMNLTLMVFFAVIAIVNPPATVRGASPGALDFSFDGDGRLSRNFSVSTQGFDVLVQPDGKILGFGTVNLGVTGTAFYVARFNADTTPDTTFNNVSGVAIIDFGAGNEFGGQLALQSDGKILIGGSFFISGTSNDLAVARLNPNGTLDTTFDGDGQLIVSVLSGTEFEEFRDIGVAPDGKIVLTDRISNDYALIRLNTNGSLDTTFSGDGILTIDIGGTTNQASDSTIQPDGKIITIGLAISATPGINGFGVVRVNTNGTLDTTFDGDGITVITFTPTTISRPTSVAVQADGRIVVAGQSLSVSSGRSEICRLTTTGTLDTTFSSDGRVEFDLRPDTDNSDGLIEIAIQPNQRIVALFNNTKDGLVRLLTNGNLDNSFGSQGIYQANDLSASSMTIQPDGKFLVVGSQNSGLLLTRHVNNIQPSASGDFDGDGFSDYAVFRPNTTNWFILRSSDSTVQITVFGVASDVPLDGDFDGDGRNDLAIYRPSLGQWWYQKSSDDTVFAAQFGISTDKTVPGDYDKDGKTDIAIFRPSTGEWLILRSSANFATFFGLPFGANGDIPIAKQGL